MSSRRRRAASAPTTSTRCSSRSASSSSAREIFDQVANSIVAQLLHLEREDPERDISIYINCPGGEVHAGLAIMDAMHLNRCDIATYCVGVCASMATVLLSAGTPGKRYAMPNSTIHMHQVLGGAQGQASDIEIEAREAIRLNDLLRQYPGQEHRSGRGAHPPRRRPQLLPDGPAGQGVRPGRRDPQQPDGDYIAVTLQQSASGAIAGRLLLSGSA